MGGQKGKKAKTDSLPSIDFSPSPSYWVHLPGFRPANPHPRSNRREGRQKRQKTRARSFTPFQRVEQRMNPLSFFLPLPLSHSPPFHELRKTLLMPTWSLEGKPLYFLNFSVFLRKPLFMLRFANFCTNPAIARTCSFEIGYLINSNTMYYVV